MDRASLNSDSHPSWDAGPVPVAIVMISLNEAHNMHEVLGNVAGWAEEVFVVDSYSKDDTVNICIQRGVRVIQRKFTGFGDQWNFALSTLPISAKWTMKMDPDERLTPELKACIAEVIANGGADAIEFRRRWWLLGSPLTIYDKVLRVWKTGTCRFTNVSVNEHPTIQGKVKFVEGYMDHLDSPDLHHWFDKQNAYSTAEAIAAVEHQNFAVTPALFGGPLQRRMLLKKYFHRIPFRYLFLFIYFYGWCGLWRSGRVGYYSAILWTSVFRWKEIKRFELLHREKSAAPRMTGAGEPDQRVRQY